MQGRLSNAAPRQLRDTYVRALNFRFRWSDSKCLSLDSADERVLTPGSYILLLERFNERFASFWSFSSASEISRTQLSPMRFSSRFKLRYSRSRFSESLSERSLTYLVSSPASFKLSVRVQNLNLFSKGPKAAFIIASTDIILIPKSRNIIFCFVSLLYQLSVLAPFYYSKKKVPYLYP